MGSQAEDIFKKIRDIPYQIPLKTKEPDYCCSGKHIALKKSLEKLGYQVRYRVCSFRWSDLHLPEKLTGIPHENNSTHVYLEVYIDNKWKIVDATWDKGLSSFFQINEWDGKTDTRIAIPVLGSFSAKKSNEVMLSENEKTVEADLKTNGSFYRELNKFLKSIRDSSASN